MKEQKKVSRNWIKYELTQIDDEANPSLSHIYAQKYGYGWQLKANPTSYVSGYRHWDWDLDYLKFPSPQPPGPWYQMSWESPLKTTIQPSTDYRVVLRSELDRQTMEIRTSIDDAKDETIRTLRSECSSLSQQNTHLKVQQERLKLSNEEIRMQLQQISANNKSMAELLSNKYQAKNLFLSSSFVLLAMVGALALYSFRGITVVDPYIAFVCLVVSIGFMALATMRTRRDQGKTE